jgi:hypothetical protein
MSMETHVFFRGKLPSKAVLSRAMKELGLPFSITPATGSLEGQSGFMPIKLAGEETGVEFSVYGDHAAVEEFADVGVDAGFERRASLRWGGDFQEAVAGMSVAAALAKLTNGVVFDEAEGRLLSPDDAIALARQNLQVLTKPQEPKRPGTRPADLKRYLKPLLKLRPDLMLIGRLLIIRPVRHLLRGAFFDRTSDKYQFRVYRYLTPLFAFEGNVGVGFLTDVHPVRWHVWEPHFEPLLFDALAEDIFDWAGKITTLEGLGREPGGYPFREEFHFASLLLAGHGQRAAEMMESETGASREQKALLERDLASLCAELRSKESEAAKALKLRDAWEPAPFPAEIPEAERARRCDDLLFLTTPWIPRPPRLAEAPPQQVGEVCFARDVLRRKGGVVMFVSLTREEAEEKHRTRQDYALATRLADGNLLVVYHRTWWSPHNPEQPKNPNYVPSREFNVEIHGALGRLLRASFPEHRDRPGVLKFWTVDVFEPVNQRSFWLAYNYVDERGKTIYDHRDKPRGYEDRPMSDSDLSLCLFPEPPFGDFNDLWRRVERYLQNEGFGTLRDVRSS